jgi:hypothetical protein
VVAYLSRTVCRNTVIFRKIPYVVVGILNRTQSLVFSFISCRRDVGSTSKVTVAAAWTATTGNTLLQQKSVALCLLVSLSSS